MAILLLPNDRPDRAKWTSADWTRGDGKEDRIGDTGGDQDAGGHNGQGLELTHSVSSFTLKLKSRWRLIFVAVPGPGQQFSGKTTFRPKFLDRGLSPIEKLPHVLVAQVGRFIDGRLPECWRRPGLPLITNAGAAGGKWLPRDERRGAPVRHSVHRTGYRAGVARCFAGSSGIHCREDRWCRLAIGALNGV
jgi:hypothetical protein